MKPTVINSANNSENNPNLQQNPADSNNNVPTGGWTHDQRGFPTTFPTHSFGFDDSDDDIFSDMGLRSRLNRMGHHPFDWGARKRRSSAGHTDPATASTTIPPSSYDQYFQDDVDFPSFSTPHWDTFNRSARKSQPQPQQQQQQQHQQQQDPNAPTDRSGFFDYLPEEFRQYIPASFAFPSMRHQQPMSPPQTSFQRHAPPHVQHHEPQQQQQFQQPQYQHTPLQQPQQQPLQTDDAARPKLCDAAIQTEEVAAANQNNLQQHGLRNTVDMGQKSPSENVRTDRAQSAPPTEPIANQQASHSYGTTEVDGNTGFSNSGTSTTPQVSQPGPQPFVYTNQQPSKQTSQQPSTGGSRTVPIFFEDSNVPVVPQKSQPHRPEPFIAKDVVDSAAAVDPSEQAQMPPQTPHTSDCITKIQAIQRDVLDLMGKIERFSGARGDREYMYLDEMLTRNLLKLDTIDTNGRDSIRLARKEAIKCIQASIAVLEAKSEINRKLQLEQSQEKVEESVEPPAQQAENVSDEPANNTHVSQVEINLSNNLNVNDELTNNVETNSSIEK